MMRLQTIALAACMAVAGGAAWSAPVEWTGGGDGTSWGQAANWDVGVPAPADDVGIQDDNADLTVDLGTDRTINSLDVRTNKRNVTLDTGAETLTVTSGSIRNTKARYNRDVTINAQVWLGAGGVFESDTNRGNFFFDGAINAGANSITVAEGKFTFNAANTYSGGTVVEDGGLLYANASGSLGTGGAVVQEGGALIAVGGALAAGQKAAVYGLFMPASANPGTDGDDLLTADSSGGVAPSVDCTVTDMMKLGNGAMSLGADGDIDLTSASLAGGMYNAYRLGGGDGSLTVVNSVLTGANDLVAGGPSAPIFQGGTEVRIDAPQDYSGRTIVETDTLIISRRSSGGTGSLTGTSEVVVRDGATLESWGGATQRIPLAAPIHLDGGQLTHAAAGLTADQAVGDVVLQGGGSAMNVGGTGGNQLGDLTIAELKRSAALRGTLTVSSEYDNGDPDKVRRIKATTPPALVGAGGGAGANNRSIIPHALWDDGTNLVTYDATDGFIPLSDAAGEYQTDINAAASGQNVKMAALQGTLDITGDRTMNALVLDTDGTKSLTVQSDTAATRTLTVESGLFRGEKMTFADTVDLAFGGAEAIVEVGGSRTTTIQGGLTGTGGLTKRGGGELQLDNTAANTLTGQYTVNEGTLSVDKGSSESIPDSVTVRVADGAALQLDNGVSETVAHIAGNGSFNIGGTTGGSDRTLTIGTNAGDLPDGGVHLNGGSISPGDYLPGTMHIGAGGDDATGLMMTGGDLNIDILNGYLYDAIEVIGDVTIANGANLNLNLLDGFVPAAGQQFDIIHANSEILDAEADGMLFGSVTPDWQVELDGTDTLIARYEPTQDGVIAEPATLAMFGLGALAWVAKVRRRRR